ncbi:hypothetical protein HC371_08360 [Escherichia coli]|nr:hypothetical protein [Escherichia coli]NPH60700.1 hypothetical protein [Escherichia coli]HAY4839859.1 hypothetical protein [Escherichia coli]
MKPHMKRGLTKVALALMLAGYCAVPVAMAEDAAWVASGTTADLRQLPEDGEQTCQQHYAGGG